MPQINLGPFVHPRRAVQSIRRDSAEGWPVRVRRQRALFTRLVMMVFGYITCRIRDDGYVSLG